MSGTEMDPQVGREKWLQGEGILAFRLFLFLKDTHVLCPPAPVSPRADWPALSTLPVCTRWARAVVEPLFPSPTGQNSAAQIAHWL